MACADVSIAAGDAGHSVPRGQRCDGADDDVDAGSGGYRINVIPSEARLARRPDAARRRPKAFLDSEPFKIIEQGVRDHYDQVVTLPTMSTGATDMAYLRARGVQCYGIGPATDIEDGAKGFDAPSRRHG